MALPKLPFNPLVCIVDFHHARGPEVEKWFGNLDGKDPAAENDWSLLPFMALSDGAHASVEELSYFTLRKEITKEAPATSLFGISCTRQIDANELLHRSADVTRSSVQKAVVAVLDSPQSFGPIRERLSAATKAWFAQRDFTDDSILQQFHDSLVNSQHDNKDEGDSYFGLSMREVLHEYKYQTLVLFKCCLLQPKMLFFGSHCEKLCLLQFALISLIPGLIRNLRDCADPSFNSYESFMVTPTSLKTSERSSLLKYMGLPLQLFGKGSLFGPYTPLQQLDMLADQGTKSYLVGSTNALLLQHKDRYSDILINLDTNVIDITSSSLKMAAVLSVSDRRWIDFLTQSVNDTWDETNPTRPNTMGYAGSEDFIRLQFEEYILALLSSVKYKLYTEQSRDNTKTLLADTHSEPIADFGSDWVEAWMKTENFRLFSKYTDSHLFDIVEPKHPCAGGLTIEDVQRRVAQQVAELHLDERFHTGREVIGKHLATGQKKVSTVFNNLWADLEVMREAQRRKSEIDKTTSESSHTGKEMETEYSNGPRRVPDFAQAQASVQAASIRAGAYLSSWGAWASEKKRTAWSGPPSGSKPAQIQQHDKKTVPDPPSSEVSKEFESPNLEKLTNTQSRPSLT